MRADLGHRGGGASARPRRRGAGAGPPATPIPRDPHNSSVTPFEGSTATPNAVGDATPPPQNPFMAPNGRSNIHDDAYQTDTYRSRARSATAATSSTCSARGVRLDHVRLARAASSPSASASTGPCSRCSTRTRSTLLATMHLPPRNVQSAAIRSPTSRGGGYFYLDNHDRAVVPTTTRHVLVVGETSGRWPRLRARRATTTSPARSRGRRDRLGASRLARAALVRHARGHRRDDRPGERRGRRRSTSARGSPTPSRSTRPGGVFIVSDKALYRFDATPTGGRPSPGAPSTRTPASTSRGRPTPGSGTTPTLMGSDYVAITDNADPMNVLVYERSKQLSAAVKKKRRDKNRAASAAKNTRERPRTRPSRGRSARIPSSRRVRARRTTP